MLWQVTKQTSSWNSDWITILIILQGAADLIRSREKEEGKKEERERDREEDWMKNGGSSATRGNATSFVIYLSRTITQLVWKGESEKKEWEIKRGRAVSPYRYVSNNFKTALLKIILQSNSHPLSLYFYSLYICVCLWLGFRN